MKVPLNPDQSIHQSISTIISQVSQQEVRAGSNYDHYNKNDVVVAACDHNMATVIPRKGTSSNETTGTPLPERRTNSKTFPQANFRHRGKRNENNRTEEKNAKTD